jgi:hypothetical protein
LPQIRTILANTSKITKRKIVEEMSISLAEALNRNCPKAEIIISSVDIPEGYLKKDQR